MNRHYSDSAAEQRGAVLLVTLVFMLILTIIASASMQSSTLQERMAGNSKDTKLAFQAAEAALRAAEAQLAQVSVGPFDGMRGLYKHCGDPANNATACVEPSWKVVASTGWNIMAADTIPQSSKPPEYFIEELSSLAESSDALDADAPVSFVVFYRVTARGYGASDRSIVVLSSTYKRSN